MKKGAARGEARGFFVTTKGDADLTAPWGPGDDGVAKIRELVAAARERDERIAKLRAGLRKMLLFVTPAVSVELSALLKETES